MKVKEKSEKAGLKLNIQKTKIMGSWPISLVQFSHSFMSNSETPILWPPDAKNWLIWKDPDAGKYWRQ